MNDHIQELRKKTQRYFYDDGVVELGIGTVFALTGVVYLIIPLIPRQLGWVIGVGLPVLILLATFGIKRIIGALKEQVVYPRTGYVQYKSEPARGRWIVIAVALALAVLAFVLPERFSSTGLVLSALLVLILVTIGARVGLNRLYVIAGIVLIAGLGITVAGIEEWHGAAFVLIVAGLGLVISGISALVAYLRDNPVEKE